jgi:hypothetical protein
MQKLEIVPIDMAAYATHKAIAYFDVNLVATRSTSVDLVQQLIKLCAVLQATCRCSNQARNTLAWRATLSCCKAAN